MNKVKIPDSLSVSNWTAVKNAIAKDKALSSKVSGESGKVATAVGTLDKASGGLDGLGDTKGLNAATAATAVKQFDADAKSAMKAASEAASDVATTAAALVKAAEKIGGDKGASTATKDAVKAVKEAFGSASKDATKYASDISAAVDAARAELEAACAKLAKPADKKTAPAPVKQSPKALADGKFLGALMRKSIALLRTPKGSPMPIKFMVLFNKANPKDLKLYLGPKPESGLAKLKTQFPPEVKVNRVKDPKGKVVWDKGALTFMSDILKGGLAKQIQLAIRAQTKVTVKVRIKRSDGKVDEADAKDVSDDELKVSPAEEAEMNAAGNEWEAGLKELDGAIQAAKKGPNAAKVQALVDAIKSAGKAEKYDVATDGLDELQSLLEEGDVSDSDGKDLKADEDKDVIEELKARLNEIPAEVLANKALKKDAVATINALQKAGIAELNKSKPALDSAKKAVDKIEDLLGAAALSTFPTAAVEKAMNDWVASRQAAIDGITELSRKINEAFAGDQTQKGDVLKALKKLGQLQIKLQNGLDNKLKAAINTKNIKAQEESVKGARQSVSSLRDFMQKDELIMNIDKHDVPGVPSLTVVSDMLKSLNAIETALPH